MSEEVESDVEGEAAASLALNPKAERDLCSLFAGSFVGFLLGIVTDYVAVVDCKTAPFHNTFALL